MTTHTQDALRVALEAIEQFQKDLYAVPNFADRVNKATRDALHQAHMNILALPARIDAALSAAPTHKGQSLESANAAHGSMEDFAEAADLVGKIVEAETNGDALGMILSYRHKIREQAADSSAERNGESNDVR